MFGIALAPLATTAATGFSFGTFFAIASGLQTILGTYSSIRNSQIQSKNLRTAAAWERQRSELQAKQQQIKINKQEKILLSEKRAAFTASGVNVTFNGDTTVKGNLFVQGTQTVVDSTTINLADNILVLN